MFIKAEFQAVAQRRSPFMDPMWCSSRSSSATGPRESAGTGFIISEDGYILTNQHIFDPERLEKIYVSVLGCEEPYEAELVGYDYDSDRAV